MSTLELMLLWSIPGALCIAALAVWAVVFARDPWAPLLAILDVADATRDRIQGRTYELDAMQPLNVVPRATTRDDAATATRCDDEPHAPVAGSSGRATGTSESTATRTAFPRKGESR